MQSSVGKRILIKKNRMKFYQWDIIFPICSAAVVEINSGAWPNEQTSAGFCWYFHISISVSEVPRLDGIKAGFNPNGQTVERLNRHQEFILKTSFI